MSSDHPKRAKPSEAIKLAAERLFENWGGHLQSDPVRSRLALRAQQVATASYYDEEQARRDAHERDVLRRLRELEQAAHTHPRAVK
jgi:hypothetical protein